MTHDVDFYISRGFDRPMAEYMAAGRRRAVSAAPLGASSVLVSFDDGESRLYDLSGLMGPGTVFSFLADPKALARVYVDEDGSVCWDRDPDVGSREAWSNKVDISADEIYVYGETLVK